MDDALRARAAEVFGWQLRAPQVEVIDAVTSGRDALAVLPTGSGKSAIYQVAGLAIDGLVVVVSPLVALQDDQVAGLRRHPDAPLAVTINAAEHVGDRRAAWEAIAAGTARYAFLAPEQLANDAVVDRLRQARVGLVTVDEAHCVSSWGEDFRPDYLLLGEAIERLGRPPVLALTATGSAPVRRDVVERLRMRTPLVVAAGFDRPELRLQVVRHEDAETKRDAVVEQVAHASGAGIVYVATHAETTAYADVLTARGRAARPYHAGMPMHGRTAVHTGFLGGEVDVVVATTAFGMGIDKPDVRWVVHADVPESVDAYYQEIGRAGRDRSAAVATLHYLSADLGLRRFFAAGSPDPDTVRAVFAAVPHSGSTERSALAALTGLSEHAATRAANLLVEASVLVDQDVGLVRAQGRRWRADDAVRAAERRADEREHVEQSRIDMMRRFAETLGCRRQFLLGYFGDELPDPCGNCDTCSSGTAYAVGSHPADGTHDDEWPPDTAVRHPVWGVGNVMSTEDDRLTVFFPHAGYRTLALADVRKRHLLTRLP
ncbi:RecQ family ATP-dependent DNA helicase [Curtobacterium sp. ISL-83]|uniref:RecQ family ATP-dependent DNA helicase n=1 Tax=Curtobacterium sp. ISL-83 TaxID=2819145 RepID=UPI001BEC41DA|nr:RecQ family ATP-dependent DNA helicase [Curtobacterium sp. ISL-83]MBT2502837.1 RecQ family ATP-dependent DNA helicase [Curtobacterium sp. ISL-83]